MLSFVLGANNGPNMSVVCNDLYASTSRTKGLSDIPVRSEDTQDIYAYSPIVPSIITTRNLTKFRFVTVSLVGYSWWEYPESPRREGYCSERGLDKLSDAHHSRV